MQLIIRYALLCSILMTVSANSANLIFNGDFELGNTGFNTDYNYTSDVYNSQTYYIGYNPSAHHIFAANYGDHTSGNGLMLIANGAQLANQTIWQKTDVSVTPDTTYAFSYWQSIWAGPTNLAAIKCIIAGDEVGVDVAPSVNGQWEQVSYQWNSDNKSKVTIRLVGTTLYYGGNDVAIDDISLLPSSPSITQHPAGQTVSEGDPVTFSVIATGAAPLLYQWQKNGNDIPGATIATYTINSVDSGDAGDYSCEVSNSIGSVSSNVATLQVTSTSSPSITQHPVGQTVNEGDPVTFSVGATGAAPLLYQWHKNGNDIPGATSATYTISSVDSGDAGDYSCEVSDSNGSVSSNVATLQVITSTSSPSITQHPAGQTVDEGDPVTFSVVVTGAAPLLYQWQKGGSNIPGATSTTYTISSTDSDDAGSYSCEVSNSNGSVSSNAATLQVVVPAAIITNLTSSYCSQNQHVYFLEGVSLNQTFTVDVDWSNLTPQWIRWYRGNMLITTDSISGSFASHTFNIGTDFTVNQKLSVVAVDSDGTESEKYTANFDVIEPPKVIPVGRLHADLRSNQELTYRTGTFSLQWPNFDAELPENNNVLNPKNTAGIRSIGTTSFDTIVEVSAKIVNKSNSIECSIGIKSSKLSSKNAFKIADVAFNAQVWVNIILTYENQWLPGGVVGCEVAADKPFGPKYWIFTAGPVPIPIFLKGAVGVMMQGELALTGLGGSGEFLFTGSLLPSAGLEVILGCGLSDIMAVEGFLEGNTGLTVGYDAPSDVTISKHYLELNGGVRAYFLIFKYENNLLHFKWPDGSTRSRMLMAASSEADTLKAMSRDYLDLTDYARWLSNSRRSETFSVQSLDDFPFLPAEATLQTNVFGQSNPHIAISGDTQCLVWLYDDPSRSSLNRTVLMYSLNDGSDWTSPVAISDDGAPDVLPDLTVDTQGRFTCTWSSSAQPLPDTTDLRGMAASLNVQSAVYDWTTGTWISETITTAAGLDYLGNAISDVEGTVVWVHDDDSDLLAESGRVFNTIMVRKHGGAGPEALATVAGLIRYLEVGTDATGRYIVYCLDRDSSLETDIDNDLFLISDTGSGWTAPIQMTDIADFNSVADVNPQFVTTSKGLMLFWARDGQIVSARDLAGLTDMTVALAQEGSSGQRGFVTAAGPTDTISVVWNDPSREGMDLYGATYDPSMDLWSDPVQMTKSRDMERSMDAIYAGENELRLVYNKVHMTDGQGLDAFGEVDLCLYDYEVGLDLAVVQDSISIDPNAVPGDTTQLTAVIASQGDFSTDQPIGVGFYCGTEATTENLIGSVQIIPNGMMSGDQNEVSVDWLIPVSDEVLNVIVLVDPNAQLEDKDLTSNSRTAEFFAPPDMSDIVFVPISEPDFTGEISRCEITNAQYCEYLNAALAEGLITVNGDRVHAADGASNETYFDTYEKSNSSQITYSGGIYQVRSRDGLDMGDHPVVCVTWYGAMAFCEYFGYRLPTEDEWQVAADYDGSYTYGCGEDIDKTKANYGKLNPLELSAMPYTTPVGYYDSFGYGFYDMAGNVTEWTSSPKDDSRIAKGGCWGNWGSSCTVETNFIYNPNTANAYIGFRVCR